MTLEKLRQKKKDYEANIQFRGQQITNQISQINLAQNNLRQQQDALMIVRGQLLEVDVWIKELEAETAEEEAEKEK